MTDTATTGKTVVTRAPDTECPECHKALVEEVCVNPNCKEAQIAATAAAERQTAKATADTGQAEVTRADPSASERPRSFASSGRPD